MSVRLVTRRRGGAATQFWMVDIEFRHQDGRIERVRRVPRVQNRRAAEQLERELLAQLTAGTFGRREVGPETFAQFADEFEAIYATTNNKPSERRTKESILRVHLRPFFGAKQLGAVTALDVARYTAKKLRGDPAAGVRPLSPKTVNNHLTVLHKLFGVAVEWQRLDRTRVPPIKWLKTAEPDTTFLSHDEAARLVAAAPEGTWRTMVTLALHTGLRQGELLALEWRDVDLVGGRLVVSRNVVHGVVGTPKSGRPREVPLNETARAALKAHRSLRRLVFTPPGDDRYLRKNECRRPLWNACKRAQLPDLGWHVLRHTFASHLVMAGATLKSVQELLGHSTIEMTMRYAHLSPAARREAVQLLDAGVPPVGGTHGNPAATNEA